MGYVFKNNTLYIPHDKEIVVGTLENFLYFLVGNEILPLNPWFIRPYPGKLLEEEKVYKYQCCCNTSNYITFHLKAFLECFNWAKTCQQSYVRKTFIQRFFLRYFADFEQVFPNIFVYFIKKYILVQQNNAFF